MNNYFEKVHNDLIKRTVKAHLKHFGLKMKDDFVYKGKTVIFIIDSLEGLLLFLEGISIVYDNLELWDLKMTERGINQK